MPETPSEPTEPTDQEMAEFEDQMRAEAEKWRARLADPQVQAQIKAGTLTLSPLVHQLLEAFPPRPTKSTGG